MTPPLVFQNSSKCVCPCPVCPVFLLLFFLSYSYRMGKKNVRFRHRSVQLFESPLKSKKYRAVFYLDGREYHHADFGGKGYRDFTLINDPDSKYYLPDEKERLEVRQRYIKRHSKMDEDFNDPFTAGALSRWVLWEKPTLRESWEFYKDKFNFS